jgi:hypothetical protein
MAITVTLTRQGMTDGSTKLKLVTPYSPTVPADCKAIGGKWNATVKAWLFDERDANRVRDLCVKHFGIDPLAEPDEAPELVTVRLEPSAFSISGSEWWMFGREIVSRPGRDSRVRLGEGVIVVSGSFPSTGGSRNNPAIFNIHSQDTEGLVLEVRDVPRPLFDQAISERVAALQAAQERLAFRENERAELEAELAAFEAAGSDWNVSQTKAKLASTRHLVTSSKAAVQQADGGMTLVETVKPEPVAVGTAQIGALFMAMAPDSRRAVIMSLIANMPSSERPALVKEIQQYLDQGAI